MCVGAYIDLSINHLALTPVDHLILNDSIVYRSFRLGKSQYLGSWFMWVSNSFGLTFLAPQCFKYQHQWQVVEYNFNSAASSRLLINHCDFIFWLILLIKADLAKLTFFSDFRTASYTFQWGVSYPPPPYYKL